VQVLNELTDVTRRQLRWDWEQIEASLAVIADLFGPVAPLATAIHSRAVALAHSDGLPACDSLIVAATPGARCKRLLRVVLRHAQRSRTLVVHEPFHPGAG
jgi:predicted nucleic acid-binding protein